MIKRFMVVSIDKLAPGVSEASGNVFFFSGADHAEHAARALATDKGTEVYVSEVSPWAPKKSSK